MTRGAPARRIVIPLEEKPKLDALARSTTARSGVVRRARMTLLAALGVTNEEIAAKVGCVPRTVCKWRRRFAEDPRVEALADARRSGRPPRVPVAARCELVKLACERPGDKAVPFRNVWTWQALADALLKHTGISISRTEVGRILAANELRPHHVRYWLHSPDPDFQEKTRRICDLYLHPPPRSVVLCIDEKPMQVLSRKHPGRTDALGRLRYEYEYVRHGTRVLLGAFDVLTGRMFGEVRPQRKGPDLVSFMEAVARRYPKGEVIVVWDNLNIHLDGPGKRWEKFNAAQGNRFRFVHTPIHASWLNQVEVWFSILERRVLRYGDFGDPASLEREVLGFIEHWNEYEAHPFRWTFRGRFQQTGARLSA